MSKLSTSQLSTKLQNWLTHIRQQESSGLAATEYCEQNQLSSGGMYNARHLLRQKGVLPPAESVTKKPFVAVRVTEQPKAILPVCRLVAPSGLALEFTEALTMSQIQSILAMPS